MTPAIEIIAAVYDFEFVMETALKSVFDGEDIQALTTRQVVGSGSDETDAAAVAAGYTILTFKKPRPRVEIQFTCGGGDGQFRQIRVNGAGQEVETSWSGQFRVTCITDADIRVHSEFIVAVRFLLQTLRPRINAAVLPKHCLQPFSRDGGTSTRHSPQEGVIVTDLLLDIHFSIQDDAWADLAT
jgi:hypothetical protein